MQNFDESKNGFGSETGRQFTFAGNASAVRAEARMALMGNWKTALGINALIMLLMMAVIYCMMKIFEHVMMPVMYSGNLSPMAPLPEMTSPEKSWVFPQAQV